MILHRSNNEYDSHTLLKGARMVGLAGIVGFHESADGYIVSFPDGENTQALIKDYKACLQDLKNNIRQLFPWLSEVWKDERELWFLKS